MDVRSILADFFPDIEDLILDFLANFILDLDEYSIQTHAQLEKAVGQTFDAYGLSVPTDLFSSFLEHGHFKRFTISQEVEALYWEDEAWYDGVIKGVKDCGYQEEFWLESENSSCLEFSLCFFLIVKIWHLQSPETVIGRIDVQ